MRISVVSKQQPCHLILQWVVPVAALPLIKAQHDQLSVLLACCIHDKYLSKSRRNYSIPNMPECYRTFSIPRR